MPKKVLVKIADKPKYPSSSVIQAACYEDYKRCIDTYDKIYEKINITLAFCAALVVILPQFDYTIFINYEYKSDLEFLSIMILLCSSFFSVVFIIWALIQLLMLMRSKSIPVFDSIGSRNEEIYRWKPEDAELWLIDKYTYATNEIRTITKEKQIKYDSAMIKVLLSLLLYAVSTIISKGV